MDFSERAADAATSEINRILCPMLDAAIEAKRKAEYAAGRGSGEGDVAAKRIGAGYIGTECERALGFQFHKSPIEERDSGTNPGELARHAEAGHWTERMTVAWLRQAGIEIQIYDHAQGEAKPQQIGWKDAKDPVTGQYQLAGQIDGIVIAVNAAPSAPHDELLKLLKPPTIWESKKATDKKWKKFCKEKVKAADPVYYSQLQINMGYLGIPQTLFSMLNLDTMKFYFELVPFDQAHAQGLLNRALGVLKTKSPYELPRLGRTEDDFVCKFCDYQNQCWHPPQQQPAAPQPFNPNLLEDPPF